ncbi:C40 family peptidase [Solitalea koreensis]|nr:NlpC/P60 family protein [Solitalea koreensis]
MPEKIKTGHKLILLFTISSFLISCKAKKNLSSDSFSRAEMPAKMYGKLTLKDKYLLAYYAQEMSIDEQEIGTNVQLYRFIDDWFGVPYRIGGLTKQGIDCSGFTQLLYKNVYDFALPRTTSEQKKIVSQKAFTDLKEGDIVFMNYDGKLNSHVGIYLKKGRFVHAASSKGVMISNLYDAWYKSHYSFGGEVR